MMNIAKRKLLGLAATWPWLAGCETVSGASPDADPLRRFRGIGVVLVVDAVPGAELKGVEFFDERSSRIYASSTLSKRNREIMALGGSRVPLTVRVVWHDSAKIVGRKDNPNMDTYDGNVLGDYRLDVAQRIPDDVLREIRAHGGALRLKFRLKTDGVLFGWDIERHKGGRFTPLMPGGDFQEMIY